MQKLKIRANILFAGIGCQERGFEDSGVIDLDVLSISEIDKNAVLSYAAIHKGLTEEMVAQFDSYPGIEEMIQELKDKNIGYDPGKNKEFDWDKIKKNREYIIKKNWLASHLSRNLGDISRIRSLPQADLWTISFPCTDISSAGEMKGFKDGTGTRSSLLWQQMRLLRAALKDRTAPDYLLYENVKALVGEKFRADFEQLLEILRGYGYEPHWEIMNARECGIPQHRERVFMLCVRKGARGGGFTFPEPFTGGKSLDEILSPPVERYPSWDTRVSEYMHDHIKDGRLYPPEMDSCQDFEGTNTEMEDNGREPYKRQGLTPETCFALMGMRPDDVSKCIDIGICKTQLCKQAGNGIVTACVKLIAEHLYKAAVDPSFICTDERNNRACGEDSPEDGHRITYGYKSGKEKEDGYIEKGRTMEIRETYEEETPGGYISNDFVMKCLRIKNSGTEGDEETVAMAKKYQKFFDGHGYVPKYFRSKDGTELRDYAGTLSTCSGSLEANGSIIIFDAVREIMIVDRNLRRGKLTWEEAERCLGRILCVSEPKELERICEIFAEKSA